ncbi:MAG: ArsC/Spx/MgsR family protein [Bacteroidales bacterium]|nr:ArsC/Spx/MgsR family protein [Bacteroidales bacterium]
MIKIYHNSRCKKSRAGLEYLKSLNKEFEVIDYLKNPLTTKEMAALIKKTGLAAGEMMRKQEEYYKENIKDSQLSNSELIAEIAANPKLLKRPLVETEEKAVWADPPENILRIL